MKEQSNQTQTNSPAQQGQEGANQKKPDAPRMNDSRDSVASENLSQSGTSADVSPEFGDAADPGFEELGSHHRDE